MDLRVARDGAVRRDEERDVARRGPRPSAGTLARIQRPSARARSTRKASDGPPGGCAIRSGSIENPVENISGRMASRAPPRRGVARACRAGAPVVFGDVFPGEVDLEEGDAHVSVGMATLHAHRLPLVSARPSRADRASSSVSSFLQNAKRA